MTFYFYDLETTGFRPRKSRIMQFAGQRTDMDLNPIGKPDNILIKLTPDVLPDPDAVLVHGISPLLTLKDGISEAEFIKYLTSQVFKPDTIVVGYNNIRFDDEFMRFTFWRNFCDAYEWQWKDGCSRWDLLDVVRMTRALRPAGLEWPVDADGKASNRLALISSINQLAHDSVHDALSDVNAVIALAKLIKTSQPQLFEYLLNIRDKNKVAALVEKGDPLVYTSGRYASEYLKTTVAVMLARQPDRGCALMYDLRADPQELAGLSARDLAHRWQTYDEDAPQFPIKLLAYNKCPAIAPIDVLDEEAKKRIKLDMALISSNLKKLQAQKDLGDRLIAALETNRPKTQAGLMIDPQKVDELLYDGFVDNNDKERLRQVRSTAPAALDSLRFEDERLSVLLPLYKARNFPESLNKAERQQWEVFKTGRLLSGGGRSPSARYLSRLAQLKRRADLDQDQRRLLSDLEAYAESVLPAGKFTGVGPAR